MRNGSVKCPMQITCAFEPSGAWTVSFDVYKHQCKEERLPLGGAELINIETSVYLLEFVATFSSVR